MRALLCFAMTFVGFTVAHAAPGKVTLKTATTKVAMLFDAGGKDDRGFNEAANRGLLRATNELGVQGTVSEAPAASRIALLEKAIAKKPDLIIGVGFLFSDDVVRLAARHPSQKFAVIDFVSPPIKTAMPDNVLGLSFRDEQGAYLVGALAALHSKTDKVGFVGGMDAPLLRRFAAGFAAGARAVKPAIDVQVAYVDKTPAGFTNPAKGKALALELYAKGVDTIFHASGATGLGLFAAAREKKQWSIGVDRTNWKDLPGLMPATMVKHLDLAVYDAITSVHKRAWQGGTRVLELANQGIALQYNELEPNLVTPEIKRQLQVITDELIAGKRTSPGE